MSASTKVLYTTSEDEVTSFFAIMQEGDYKIRLAMLENFQKHCKTAGLRARLPAEIARARRYLMWGKIAEENPLPPAA